MARVGVFVPRKQTSEDQEDAWILGLCVCFREASSNLSQALDPEDL